jgi:hypothetical protein
MCDATARTGINWRRSTSSPENTVGPSPNPRPPTRGPGSLSELLERVRLECFALNYASLDVINEDRNRTKPCLATAFASLGESRPTFSHRSWVGQRGSEHATRPPTRSNMSLTQREPMRHETRHKINRSRMNGLNNHINTVPIV